MKRTLLAASALLGVFLFSGSAAAETTTTSWSGSNVYGNINVNTTVSPTITNTSNPQITNNPQNNPVWIMNGGSTGQGANSSLCSTYSSSTRPAYCNQSSTYPYDYNYNNGTYDPYYNNNSSYNTNGYANDVDLNVTSGQTTVLPGDTITYTITVYNRTSYVMNNIALSNDLPSEVSYLSSSTSGYVSGGVVRWPSFSLSAGQSRSFTVRGRVTTGISYGRTIVDQAFIDGGPTDQDTTTINANGSYNNTNCYYNGTYDYNACNGYNQTSGNVSVSISDSPDPVLVGNLLTYTIILRNADYATRRIVVTATLDPDTTFSSASYGGYSQGSQTVQWNDVVVNTSSNTILTLTVRVDSSAYNGGSLNLMVNADGRTATQNTRISGSSTCSTCYGNGNVTVSVSDSVNSVNPGDLLTYTILLRNDSSYSQTVSAVASLDPQTTFSSASYSGYNQGYQSVRWDSLVVGANQTRTLSLTVRVNSSAHTGDTLHFTVNAGGDSATNDTSIGYGSGYNNGDVTLTVTDSPDPVNAGGLLTYTITVRNSGSYSQNVDVLASLDPNTTFSSASSGGYNRDNRTVEWTNLILGAFTTRSLTLTTRVSSSIYSGNSVHLTVSANGATASQVTSVSGTGGNGSGGDVSITKTADRTDAAPGDLVTFTLTIHNNAGRALSYVTVEDDFHSGDMLIVSANANAVVDANRISWTLATLARARSVTFTYTARLNYNLPRGFAVQDTAFVSGPGIRSSTDAHSIFIR